MGMGEVVRWVKVLPSERVTSWVKVYGRFGRRRSEAWRICWVALLIEGVTVRRSVWFSILADVVRSIGDSVVWRLVG